MKHHTIKTLATALLLTGMVAVACHKEGDATKATVQNIRSLIFFILSFLFKSIFNNCKKRQTNFFIVWPD